MTSSSLRKNTQHTNLYGADLSDAALGRYDEPPWRLLRSGGLSVRLVCLRKRWAARRVVKDLCFRRRCGAYLYSGTVWMPFPSIAFELEPGLGWDWWHTGAGRRMPEKKDNTFVQPYFKGPLPLPHTWPRPARSPPPSSRPDWLTALWFKHLHGWHTYIAF